VAVDGRGGKGGGDMVADTSHMYNCQTLKSKAGWWGEVVCKASRLEHVLGVSALHAGENDFYVQLQHDCSIMSSCATWVQIPAAPSLSHEGFGFMQK